MNIKTKLKSLLAGAMALGGLFASAAPTVEITKVESTTSNCVVSCWYTVSGLEGAKYDLVIKVGAKDAEKGAVSKNLVFESIAEDCTVFEKIDCKNVLGKAYPNVTFYATLETPKEPWQKNIGAVQLWEGGPYWADRNVGAKNPEESGFWFWWGDTEGYVRNAANNGWVSAKDGTTPIQFEDSLPANQTCGMDIVRLKDESWIDSTTGNLTMAHDAARVKLGGEWRMPTADEMAALINNTTTRWETRNGVWGRLVKGKGAYSDASIFFPAAGFGSVSGDLYDSGELGSYWSSTPNSDNSDYACFLEFDLSDFSRFDFNRFLGFTVRPVRESAE